MGPCSLKLVGGLAGGDLFGGRPEDFVCQVSVGGLLGTDGVPGECEAGAGNRQVAVAHGLPGAHILQAVLLHPRGHGVVVAAGERSKEIDE